MSSRAARKRKVRQEQGIEPRPHKVAFHGHVLPRRKNRRRNSTPVKMSEVLLDFIDPYVSDTPGDNELRSALTLGMVAWNAALLPEEDRPAHLDDLIEKAIHSRRDEFREVIGEMIARKDEEFGWCDRYILSYEVTWLPDGSPHVLVLSAAD